MLLWQMVAHNSYHIGPGRDVEQSAWRAWPPAEGEIRGSGRRETGDVEK